MPLFPSSPAWRRRLAVAFFVVLALIPVGYIGSEAVSASRNTPFFDEIDSALDFVLRLGSSPSWSDAGSQFLALSNEHRMVTSRALFAASYWLTGSLNFHVVGAIGNLFIVGTCLLLLGSVKSMDQRLRLGVVLAFLVFQLEHYENFIWSGASIDHFQVVMLATAAVVLLAKDSGLAVFGAAVFALLATFTLVHGAVVWLLGGVWLAYRRRWVACAGWTVAASLALAAFFNGFTFNPGHHIELTPAAAPAIGYFWLQLIGAPLMLGNRAAGAVPGLFLLVGLAFLMHRGALHRHPAQMLLALFGVGSLLLVAVGRLHVETGGIASRYLILGAMSWAMLLHILLEEAATAEHPFRWLAWTTPALIGCNVAAAIQFQVPKEAFIEVRDRAATFYQQYGHAGVGISRIHPDPRRADQVLARAAERGVFRFPSVSPEVHLPEPKPSTRLVVHVDELVIGDRTVTIGGWAMARGNTSKRGHVYLILKSDTGVSTYRTLTIQRPDVARAYGEPRWRLCGFRAVLGREQLPSLDFSVGMIVDDDEGLEYTMTPDVLSLAPRATSHGQLATVP